MAKQTLPTRALLACGAVAGPMYVTVTIAEALTRDGFDLRQHRFSWLTTGDLGWIHQSNMVLVGVLTVLLAVGVRQMVRTSPGKVWGPRLLGMFGVAYIVGGMLRADPVTGFPPGTTPEMVHTTWHGAVQNASRGASSLLLIATSLVIAGWFAAEGRRAWAWFYGAAIPTVFVALTAVGLAIGGNPTALAFLVTPWTWVTALAVHLYRREAKRAGDRGRTGGPRMQVQAVQERKFYEDQSGVVSGQLLGLAVFVAIVIGIGAVFGGRSASRTVPGFAGEESCRGTMWDR